MIRGRYIVILFIWLVSCSPKNLISHGRTKKYIETNTYQYYSKTIILRHSFRKPLDKSKEIKDNFGINYMIHDSNLVTGKRSFDLTLDSSMVYIFFKLPKISFLDSKKFKLSGTIEILQWDSSKVILKQNVDVINFKSKVINHITGQKEFLRSKGGLKLYFD